MPTKGQKALAAKESAKAVMKAQPKLNDKKVDEPVSLTEVSGSKKNKSKAAKKASTARY